MSLAVINQNVKRTEILNQMVAAMHDQNAEGYSESIRLLAQDIEEEVLSKAQELANVSDREVLSQRGVRQLTSKEKKYYEALAKAWKATDPKQALTNIETVMPETIVDSVFDDLREKHELLNAIDFTNTKGMIKFLLNTNERAKAVWGNLTAVITKELSSGFKEVNMELLKLSAFIPVSQAMLDLGPEWLDRYVREVLYEAIANGLEDSIINNLVTDSGTIGMIADLKQGTANGNVITYKAKTATAIKDLQPATIGKEIAKLAVDENGKARVVQGVLFIVNPVDYFTTIFPATTVMGGDGTYRRDVMPFPMTIIQSAAVAQGKAIMGLGKRYFMGVGMGTKDGRIEFDDSCQFIEDNRVYKIKLYANGMPKDNNAFLVFDITDLKPLVIKVSVVSDEEVPAPASLNAPVTPIDTANPADANTNDGGQANDSGEEENAG
ncbi:MAG: phage major capsid protein [Anaerorhabdus sp.]|uniref:phage major capsid protein n=1 Tax=Anaerorhabdus sp. TaxID=1872524 RepID=UPI003A8A01F5